MKKSMVTITGIAFAIICVVGIAAFGWMYTHRDVEVERSYEEIAYAYARHEHSDEVDKVTVDLVKVDENGNEYIYYTAYVDDMPKWLCGVDASYAEEVAF